MHHGVTLVSPNPSLTIQTHPKISLTILQKRESTSREDGMVDWNKVRRVDANLSEDEKEALLDRLNEMVEKYRSLNTEYYVDPEEEDE
tara:strand:+ start:79 stop:342 length:264 start_codon:yes stop_codon:yes gene_type:complete